MQARRSFAIGASVLFLLLLGMTLGVRPGVLVTSPLAPFLEYAAVAHARIPVTERVRKRPLLRAARGVTVAAMPAAAVRAAPDPTPEAPAPDEPAPAIVVSMALDLEAVSSASFPWITPIRVVPSARPQSLVPLYAAFAALQVADTVTTVRVLRQGGFREGNPVVRSFARNVPAMVLVKSASTAVTLLAVEKLWRKNRVAAVATMAGINAADGIIVSRNAAALR